VSMAKMQHNIFHFSPAFVTSRLLEGGDAVVAMSIFLGEKRLLLLRLTVLFSVCSIAHASGRCINFVEDGERSRRAQSFKSEHGEENDKITFAVILSAFERENEPHFRLPCVNSFYSIAQQTYKRWYLILNGDGISSKGIGRIFQALKASGIPEEKVIFRNMDHARRERFMYDDQNNEHWLFSGVNSVNMALDIAYNLETVTHVARLDEDDVWLPSHLQNLAEAYRLHPDVGFVHTQAMGYSNPFNNDDTSRGFPHPAANLYTFQPPVPCELIHSTSSWSTNLKIFYRQLEEQRQNMHNRSLEVCCKRPCNAVLAYDADMWERIYGLVQRGDLASLYVSRADVLYLVRSEREQLLDLLINNGTDTSKLGIMKEREDLSLAFEACRNY